ncbi:unnamed protein product, partial [Prorocentrum cordatum]
QLMALLARQASLMGALAQSGGRQPDALSLLADGGRDEGLGESSGMRLGGARGAAALELFRRQVQSSPQAVSALVRRNRQLNMTGAASEEGMSDSTRNYFARNVPFGQARSSAFLVFGMAEVFDLMERALWRAAEAQLALLLCASEQAALREWRWTSAWLLTHLPEPPWTSIRQAPARGQIRPMSRLASPEWVAAAIGYTKDTLALEGAERKLAPAAAPRAEEGGGKGGGSKRHGKAAGAPPHERLVGGSNSLDVGIRWGFGLIRRLRGLRAAFGAFVRSSMHAAGFQEVATPAAGLLPCPPPFGWAAGTPPRGVRARRRWLRTHVEHMWVNAVILALSHLHLGESRSCPPRARAGRPLSSSQSEMVSRLSRLVRPMCRPLQWQGGRVEKADALLDYLLRAMHLPVGAVAPSPDCEMMTIDPSKAPFAKAECHFDPLAFMERARQAGKPGDLLEHLKQWDDVGRLELVDAADSPQALRGTLFPVFKDASTQRVVFNRIARNSSELPLGGFSRLTPSAAVLVDLEVPAGSVLRVWADDLQDFYPAFDCTYDMACTNDVALPLPTRLYEGFAALGRLRKRCRREGRELPEKVVPCHGGLIMGGLNAPDWACEPHMRLLAQAGSFPPERRVLNRHLAPEGSAWEGVVLGDHFGLAVDDPGSREARRAIEESFARAREGYAKAGLRVSAGKEVKDAAEATVIGAELLGHDRLVGASRARRLALAWMGLSMARGRRSTTLGLQRFLGMGLFAALFRRPTLSLLHHCYKEVDVDRNPHDVFDLSSAACNECALFAVLAPLMATDLSAGWGPQVLASDASHLAGASVKTPASAPTARAFWRQREQRGARTWLHPSGWAAMANPEDGAVLQDLEEDAAPPPGIVDPTASLIEYFDVLELCCGEEARLMGYLSGRGLRTGPRIDIKCHKYGDLVDSRLAEWIAWLIWQRRGGHAGASAHLISGHGTGLHEHPLTAYSWRTHIVEFLLTHKAVDRFDLSMCQFGAPWKKDTSLLVVRGSWLAPMARRCRGGHKRTVLEGGLTPKAALYPHGFCDELSKLIADTLDGPTPPPPAESSAPAGAFEAFWLNDYVGFAPWQLHCHRLFRKPLHINLLEIDAACDAVDEQGLRFPDCKHNLLLDSRVSIGAISKGRPSSTAINKLLRRRAPLQLATGSYVGCHFAPTRLQPAGVPSRTLRDPASALARGAEAPPPAPCWLAGLEAGGASAFRAWAALPLQRRQQSRWAWLVACLWWRGLLRLAPRPRVRDPALGFPGEGPRGGGGWPERPPMEVSRVSSPGQVTARLLPGTASLHQGRARGTLAPASCAAAAWPARPLGRLFGLLVLLLLRGPAAAPRPPTARPAGVDLTAARGLTPVVQERRAALVSQLQHWPAGHGGPSWDLYILMDPATVARYLAMHGQFLCDTMRSRHDYDETINAVVDANRALRHRLDAAWDISFTWKHLTPGSNHQAMPEALLLASVSLALAWGWRDVAGCLPLGFFGMMRPFELLRLRFGDLVLPSRTLE